jgi:cation:H+ antiporter
MPILESFIANSPLVAWLVLAVAFLVLAKCADIFVDSAAAVAGKLHIPKLVIGIVLVSFATTAPELAVSLTAALKGTPEMALGNAIGSVICDDGLALALAGVFAVGGISVLPRVLRISGSFLIGIELITFFFVFRDYTLSRGEGAVLVGLFLIYLGVLFHQHRTGKLSGDLDTAIPETLESTTLGKILLSFALSLTGIIIASKFVVSAATSIAHSLNIPEAVIALTLVALGTSIPEIATCISSARKGHGEIAVGNIIGADILNLCWVAGASAMANELVLNQKQIYFMFPAMFVIVGAMLLMLRHQYRLTRGKGLILFGLYLVYLIVLIRLFPPQPAL